MPRLIPVDHDPFSDVHDPFGSPLVAPAFKPQQISPQMLSVDVGEREPIGGASPTMRTQCPLVSRALSEDEAAPIIAPRELPEGVYLHNSKKHDIDFSQGGGNYGNSFFVQRSSPDESQFGPHLHAFKLKGNVLDADSDEFSSQISKYFSTHDQRGTLPSNYQHVLEEYGGDHARAAEHVADEVRGMNLVDNESALMDLGEHLSEAGYHGVKVGKAALLYDPESSLVPLKSGADTSKLIPVDHDPFAPNQ